jgi:hypothetical protein
METSQQHQSSNPHSGVGCKPYKPTDTIRKDQKYIGACATVAINDIRGSLYIHKRNVRQEEAHCGHLLQYNQLKFQVRTLLN